MPNSKNIRCSVCVALKVAALAIAALAGPLAWAQTTSPEPQLFEIQISDLAVENGKKLNARFSETKYRHASEARSAPSTASAPIVRFPSTTNIPPTTFQNSTPLSL